MLQLLASLNITTVATVPRNLCCLHLASAMVTYVVNTYISLYWRCLNPSCYYTQVPYDSKGKKTTERTLLSLEVGARVKLAPAHDHNLVPGFSLLNQNLSRAQRDKLASPGPKYGSVTRVCPEKCAYEVTK